MPNEWGALCCELGLWGWIIAAIGLALTAFPAPGELRKSSAALFGGGVIACYALWVLGMVLT